MHWLMAQVRKSLVKLRNLREFLRRGGMASVTVLKVPKGEILKGRRILVTGGSSGIGLAIAKRCIEEGGCVVIAGRNSANLEKAEDAVASASLKVMPWDVSNTDAADTKIREAEGILGGPIDVFVNNAGISSRQSLPTLTREVWDSILGVNLTGAVFAARAICERWVSIGRKGVLLNVASNTGIQLVVDGYGTSKTALIQLTRGFASTYADKGIRINCIAPGVIVGTKINKLQRSISADGNLYCDAYPSKRFGVPSEIAEIALFLVSDQSASIYGQTIVCDGGATLV